MFPARGPFSASPSIPVSCHCAALSSVHGPRPVVDAPAFVVSCQVEELSGRCQLTAVTGPLPGFACQICAVRGPRSPLRGPPLARPRVYHYFCRYFFSREKFTAELNFLRLFRIRNDLARWTSTPFFDKTLQGSRTPPTGKMFHVKHPSSSKYDYPTPAAGPDHGPVTFTH